MDDLLHVARRMMLHAPCALLEVPCRRGGARRGRLDPWRLQRRELGLPARPVRRSLGHRRPGVGRRKRILECVVIGPGPEVITPCGGCRQKLREFASDDLPIHLCGPDGLHRTVTLGQLLPMSFGPHHLAKP